MLTCSRHPAVALQSRQLSPKHCHRSRAPRPAIAAPGATQRGPPPGRVLVLAAAGGGQTVGQRPGAGISFRRGRWQDAPLIFHSVLQESMNPLVGLAPERFTIAERGGAVLGFGQTRPLAAWAAELASLVVLPEHRGEGVGSALIQQLVAGAPAGHDIYLTTIGRRAALYQRQGFQEVPKEEVPGPLQFEVAAGTIVAKLAVNDRLVVMRRPAVGAGPS